MEGAWLRTLVSLCVSDSLGPIQFYVCVRRQNLTTVRGNFAQVFCCRTKKQTNTNSYGSVHFRFVWGKFHIYVKIIKIYTFFIQSEAEQLCYGPKKVFWILLPYFRHARKKTYQRGYYHSLTKRNNGGGGENSGGFIASPASWTAYHHFQPSGQPGQAGSRVNILLK